MQALFYPPGPRSMRPLGYLRQFRRDPLGTMTYLQQHYGDFVRFRLGPRNLYLVSDPEMIHRILVTDHQKFCKGRATQFLKRVLGEGLLTSEGEYHLRQRRLMQPAFHRSRLVSYAGIMTAAAGRLSQRWQQAAARQDRPPVVDMHQEMMRLTLAIAGQALFGADVEDEAPEIGQALTNAIGLFDRFNSPLGQLMDRLPLPSNRRFAESSARLDATIYRMIAERRSSAEDRGDLLSMLLTPALHRAQCGASAAQDEENGRGMTDRQVRDEAMTLFLAGHETTANALTWTWYLLAQNPEAEARLHDEVARVLDGRAPGFDDLPRLPYARAVLTESMRLYPPAFVIGREPVENYFAGQYVVPAGDGILMSQYVVHHDERFYPDPFRFEPDRWTAEAQEGRPKFAYFPFGGGPRVCIGEQFAWTEGILVLTTLVQRWQPRHVPGHPVAMRPLITLRPKYGMEMTLDQRRVGR